MSNSKTGWSPTLAKGTFRWALDEIITVTGDDTKVTYTSDAGNLYPLKISYNGHVSNNGYTGVFTPTHTLEFTTEARTDKSFCTARRFALSRTSG